MLITDYALYNAKFKRQKFNVKMHGIQTQQE